MLNYHTDIKIRIVDKLDDFERLENSWNKLLRSSHFNSIFLTYQWFSSFINSFKLVDKLFIIIIYIRDDLVGILPLYRDNIKFVGIKFNILRSITNVHTPKFYFIIKSGYEHLIEKALSQSIEIYSWNMIQLDYVIEDPYLLNKCHSNTRKPFKFKSVEELKSPHLIINSDWTDYWHSRIQKTFRDEIKRREKRAHEKFEITFEQISGELLRSIDLKEAFLIENSGWKGRIGSSILKNLSVKKFYHKIAFAMNSQGCFELFFLSLDGKRVAFKYCLKYDSSFYSLKSGYLEEYKRFGIGSMIQKMFVKYAFMNKYKKVDLCGTNDSYKLKWTNGIDVLYGVYIFNRRFKSYILKFFLFDAPELINKFGIKDYLRGPYLKLRSKLNVK